MELLLLVSVRSMDRGSGYGLGCRQQSRPCRHRGPCLLCLRLPVVRLDNLKRFWSRTVLLEKKELRWLVHWTLLKRMRFLSLSLSLPHQLKQWRESLWSPKKGLTLKLFQQRQRRGQPQNHQCRFRLVTWWLLLLLLRSLILRAVGRALHGGIGIRVHGLTSLNNMKIGLPTVVHLRKGWKTMSGTQVILGDGDFDKWLNATIFTGAWTAMYAGLKWHPLTNHEKKVHLNVLRLIFSNDVS